MSFKQVIELADLLDDGRVTGEDVVKYVTAEGNVKASCTTVTGAKGSTDFVKFLIPGKNGKTKGGTAPRSASSAASAVLAPARNASASRLTATAHLPLQPLLPSSPA